MTALANMTLQELEALIDQRIDQKLGAILGQVDDKRTLDDVRKSIERHRWTPPAGAQSSLELLREDRDR